MAGVTLVTMAGGCSIQRPTATYTTPPSTSQDQDQDVLAAADAGGQLFDLPVSQILVTMQKQPQQQPAAARGAPANGATGAGSAGSQNPATQTVTVGTNTYTIQALPIESGNQFRIQGQNSFLATTAIQIQYRPSSLVPSSVQVAFTDQTVNRVTEIGTTLATIASAVAPFVATPITGPKPPACPKAVPLTDFTFTVPSTAPSSVAIDGQPCWVYSVQFIPGGKPAGSVSLASFKAQAESLHLFPVPACRDVIVTVAPNAAHDDPKILPVSFKVRVGTPDYLYPVLLPQKGAINLDPVCGASVTDSPTDATSQILDAVNAGATKLQGIESTLMTKKAAATSDGVAAKPPAAPAAPRVH